MPYNNFSIGKDTQLVVIGPFGRVDFTHVIAFESQQLTTSVRVERLDGTLLGAELPKGWQGSFQIERGDSAADNFIAAIEQAYFQGGNVVGGTMYQYVTETDGSTSTYQYSNVVFKLVSAGLYKGDAAVLQKLQFYASTRQLISG